MAKLVECIPNFSLSKEKNEAGYNALIEVAKSVPGCILFDAQTDGNHNRSVFTLLGSPEAVEEVAFRLAKKAMELIDMNRHVGEHSRMGATDVIPFVPTMDVTVEECVEMSKRLGKRMWEELKIPSFLYEDSATVPERRNLATCRKGQFEGMPEKLLQPEWAPDFGERKIHPTAGITAIGARPPLVAFNVNLATSDVQIAKKIAKVIRASSGGFKACKAMGFMLEDRGIAQVSGLRGILPEARELRLQEPGDGVSSDRYAWRVNDEIIRTERSGLHGAGRLLRPCSRRRFLRGALRLPRSSADSDGRRNDTEQKEIR